LVNFFFQKFQFFTLILPLPGINLLIVKVS
jgi:hypothetical protein